MSHAARARLHEIHLTAVFEDADLDAAIAGSAFAIFHNQGQACIAGSRLLLHTRIADQFLDGFLALARSIRLGDPLDRRTEMGPLTSRMHQERVLAYCDVARREGGEILLGGKAPNDPALARGCFVEPTVVRAEPHHTVCRDEVFGPFVTVTTFGTEHEALRLANEATPDPRTRLAVRHAGDSTVWRRHAHAPATGTELGPTAAIPDGRPGRRRARAPRPIPILGDHRSGRRRSTEHSRRSGHCHSRCGMYLRMIEPRPFVELASLDPGRANRSRPSAARGLCSGMPRRTLNEYE